MSPIAAFVAAAARDCPLRSTGRAVLASVRFAEGRNDARGVGSNEKPMRRLSPALVLALVCVTACNGDDPSAGKTPAKAEAKTDPEPAPAPDPVPVEPKPEDPFADDEWEDGEGAEAGESGEAPPPAVAKPEGPWPGPCKITYKGGPVLRFKYTDAGGTVRVDEDNDGTADTCGKFDRKDGHTTRVSIDLGCDKKTDLRIEPRRDAAAAAGVKLLAAKITATEDNGGNRDVTLVDLGVFGGLEPGFVLSAPLADIESKKDAKGNLTKAAVKGDGGAKLTIAYDKDGRVKSIDEDADGDGIVDRKFTYKFDAKGNVSKIDVTVTTVTPAAGAGAKPTTTKAKQAATLDYSCWK